MQTFIDIHIKALLKVWAKSLSQYFKSEKRHDNKENKCIKEKEINILLGEVIGI